MVVIVLILIILILLIRANVTEKNTSPKKIKHQEQTDELITVVLPIVRSDK